MGHLPQAAGLKPTKRTGLSLTRFTACSLRPSSPSHRAGAGRLSVRSSGTYSPRLSTTPVLEQSKHCSSSATRLLPPWAVKLLPQRAPESSIILGILGHSEVRPHPRDYLCNYQPVLRISPSRNYEYPFASSCRQFLSHPIQSSPVLSSHHIFTTCGRKCGRSAKPERRGETSHIATFKPTSPPT